MENDDQDQTEKQRNRSVHRIDKEHHNQSTEKTEQSRVPREESEGWSVAIENQFNQLKQLKQLKRLSIRESHSDYLKLGAEESSGIRQAKLVAQ